MKLRALPTSPFLLIVGLSIAAEAAFGQGPSPMLSVTLQQTLANTFGIDALGDVNGDGCDDMVLRHGTTTRIVSGRDGTTLHTLAAGRSMLGRDCRRAGDVDGDGVEDVIVADHGVFPDVVRIFSGATGALIRQMTGPNNVNLFAYSVAGLGDINQDGFDDYAIGSPFDNTNGMFAGRVQVHSGANGALLMSLNGPVASSELGTSVDSAGDVNLDGIPDIVVGGTDPTLADTGIVRVYSGANGAQLLALSGSGNFGIAVAGIGDVSGDGRADFVIGQPRGGASQNGIVTVRSGADGSILHQLTGAAQDFLGTSVAPVGDFDQDGTSDFMVGVARTFLIGAAVTGRVRVCSGATGGLLAEVSGLGMGFQLSAGDMDGDGLRDILATEYDNSVQRVTTKVFTGAVFQYAYPGTGEDILLNSGTNGSVDAFDVKYAAPGSFVEIEMTSPSGTLDEFPVLMLAQFRPTSGAVPVNPMIGSAYLDLALPLLTVYDSTQSVFATPGLPPLGLRVFVGFVPVGLGGLSLITQGFVLGGPAVLNGLYAATNAHEIRLMP